MSLADRFKALRADKADKNLENQYIGDLKGYKSTERYDKGAKTILADSNFICAYSSMIEPHIEEGGYNEVSVNSAELNTLHRREKNRQMREHPGGFDVAYSVDYNFGVALGKTADERAKDLENGDLLRMVENVLRYRPATYHATGAKVMKDGVVEWRDVLEDLGEPLA